MQCIKCGHEKFTEKEVQIKSTIKDEIVEVIAPAFVCCECDETLMNSDQMDFLRKSTMDKYLNLRCRYVCSECLRTFKSSDAHDDYICWKCGNLLLCITEGKVYEKTQRTL